MPRRRFTAAEREERRQFYKHDREERIAQGQCCEPACPRKAKRTKAHSWVRCNVHLKAGAASQRKYRKASLASAGGRP